MAVARTSESEAERRARESRPGFAEGGELGAPRPVTAGYHDRDRAGPGVRTSVVGREALIIRRAGYGIAPSVRRVYVPSVLRSRNLSAISQLQSLCARLLVEPPQTLRLEECESHARHLQELATDAAQDLILPGGQFLHGGSSAACRFLELPRGQDSLSEMSDSPRTRGEHIDLEGASNCLGARLTIVKRFEVWI